MTSQHIKMKKWQQKALNIKNELHIFKNNFPGFGGEINLKIAE